MPSPFPGMNPYLEQADVWTDFHDRLIPAIADSLAAQVDPDYLVRIQEHLFRHEGGFNSERLAGLRDQRIPLVEIHKRVNRRLATVIDVLSPTNKYPGPARDQHTSKRDILLHTPVHLVEIDLLRGGPRMFPAGKIPECDYCVLVSRYDHRPSMHLWPFQLRHAMPIIPIPLQASHPDAKLDLQQLLHRVYDAARYRTYVYDGCPSPGISSADAAWAEEIVRRART